MKPNAINYLSIARKAGRIEVGEEPVGACARAGHARLVVVAGDAPDNTVRRARNFIAGTEQQMVVVPFTKDEMGAALGRSSVALAAMTDVAMALAFLKALEDPARCGKAIADLENRAKRLRQHMLEEKAHERNVRTGKKRTQPEAPKAPETPKEEPKETKKEKPAYRDKDTHRNGKPFHKDEGRKPFRKDGEKKPFHKDGEHKPFRKDEGKKPFRKDGEAKPFHGGKLNKKPADGPRKPAFGSASGSRRPAAQKAAGRKTGRKTHGGAEL